MPGEAAMLDRRTALPELLGEDLGGYLIVAGLGGASKDMAALTGDAPNLFAMEGAMGGASMVGLGLALARPANRVLVVTGDGELMMNVGALATIAAIAPANLAIVCIDNARYGETGYQTSLTGHGADLAAMARGAGLERVTTIAAAADLAAGRAFIEREAGPLLAVLEVAPTDSRSIRHELDPAACRLRFRRAVAASTPVS